MEPISLLLALPLAAAPQNAQERPRATEQERPRAAQQEPAQPAGRRGWLGISVRELPTGEEEGEHALARPALEVLQVAEGSPAQAAGVRAGDLLVAVDERRIATYRDLTDALDPRDAGARVRLAVRRSVPVELVLRPGRDDDEGEPAAPRLGVTIGAGDEGLTVASVEPGMGAARAGIRPGDRILAVEGARVESVDEVLTLLDSQRPGARIDVTFERTLSAQLGRAPFAAVEGAAGGRDSADERAEQPQERRDGAARAGTPRRAEGAAREAGGREAAGAEQALRQEIQALREELRSLREELQQLRRELKARAEQG